MRFPYFTLAVAALVAVGAWQVGAGQESGAKNRGKPDAGDLIKHGDYLVNEVAHCSHCHTAHDAQGQPDRSRLLRGATLDIAPKQKTKDWADESPDITSKGLAGQWSEAAMIRFLTTGVNPAGQKPTPPMPVFHLTARDARAVYLYLKSLPGSKGSGAGEKESKNPD